MGERQTYYHRRHLGQVYPSEYLSLITDGMAQQHCILPWMKGLNSPVDIKQHLQGTLVHGKSIVIYRTFNNVRVVKKLLTLLHLTLTFKKILNFIKLNANQLIHVLLLQLENLMIDGVLPKTIYVQVDGGPENANKLVLAVLTYLMTKRIGGCQKMFVTRLPVGHTHEVSSPSKTHFFMILFYFFYINYFIKDFFNTYIFLKDIDGIYGRISQYIYDRHILTPQAYANAIKKALSSESLLVDVIDLYVIPDYKEFFAGCIDKNFGCAYKSENSKLQFILEAVEPDISKYPLGVKLTYRRYTQDLYPQLTVDPSAPLGISVALIKSKEFPEEDGKQFNVLLKLPDPSKNFKPDAFEKDFITTRSKYFRKLEKTHANDEVVMDDLVSFKNEFPDVESSFEWIKKKPIHFYVPFLELFREKSSVESNFLYLDKRKAQDKALFEGIPTVEDFDSVKRSDITVKGGQRFYSNPKVYKNEKIELPVPIDSGAKKFSKLAGFIYSDTEENTRHKIHSILSETDMSGRKTHSFKIENIGNN